MTPLNPIVEALVCRLDDNLREAFEERAGIVEFEAGKPREIAECLALLEVIRNQPLAVSGVTAMRAIVGGQPLTVLTTDQVLARQLLQALGGTGIGPADLPHVVTQLSGVARLTALG